MRALARRCQTLASFFINSKGFLLLGKLNDWIASPLMNLARFWFSSPLPIWALKTNSDSPQSLLSVFNSKQIYIVIITLRNLTDNVLSNLIKRAFTNQVNNIHAHTITNVNNAKQLLCCCCHFQWMCLHVQLTLTIIIAITTKCISLHFLYIGKSKWIVSTKHKTKSLNSNLFNDSRCWKDEESIY